MYEDKKRQLIARLMKTPKAILSIYFGILVEDMVKLEMFFRKSRYIDLLQYYKKIDKVSF